MAYRTCPTCGATHYAGPAQRLDAIPGNEHVKRALEVALVEFHSVGFAGWQAETFADWFDQHGGTAYVAKACPCGNYLSPRYECKCTVSQIRTWRKKTDYQRALKADIWIKAEEPNQDKVLDMRREKDEDILDRVSWARTKSAYSDDVRGLDSSCQTLLKAYLSQVGHPERVSTILRVSSSIARLALQYSAIPAIKVEHLAEAMQYTPREEDL